MKPEINIFENLMLFLPLNYAVCIVSTALRRKDLSVILKQGTRLFIGMSIAVVVASAAIYGILEFVLSR